MENVLSPQSSFILQALIILRLVLTYLVQSDIPLLYIAWIITISIFSFFVYGYDKLQAVRGGYRVPEYLLHLLAFSGGFLGCALGMIIFHHKVRKWYFKAVIILATLLHCFVYLSLFSIVS